MFDESRPLFLQVAERIENDIADGTLAEGDRTPSTNELAAFYRINPATAAKGISHLAAAGIAYKKRGIGMFVADGARDQILRRRRSTFVEAYVKPLLAEAVSIGLTPDQVIDLIQKEGQ